MEVCCYHQCVTIHQFYCALLHNADIIFHLLRQLAADTAHTTNKTTQKIYRNTKV